MIRYLLLAGMLAIAICLVILNVTSCSMSSTLKNYVEAENARQGIEWQQYVIYDIIEKQTATSKDGVTEAAIKKEYPAAAGKLDKADVPKDELTDHVLRKHLLDLSKSGAIKRTKDGFTSNIPTP